MEGAPKLEEQPNGPFAGRKRFNRLVKAVQAILNWRDSGGASIVYGENAVLSSGLGGQVVKIAVIWNGSEATLDVVAKGPPKLVP